MSDKQTVKKILRDYIIARIPFIAINTIERDRVLDILSEIVSELETPFFVHSLSKGVYNLSTKQNVSNEKNIYVAMDQIGDMMRKKEYQGFLFTDMTDMSNECDITHQLLDLVSLANESNSVVITLTHTPIWSQLQRQGMLIQFDLPTEEEMFEIIKRSIRSYNSQIHSEWDDKDIREAALLLSGVTKIEAENIISTLAAKRNIVKSDLNDVRYYKNRMFSNISGLEKIELDEEFIDVGGLAGLQNWLELKKVLLQPEKRSYMQKIGLQPPRGILLVGVPGCGKSLSAKMIAKSWKLPLFRLDFATVQGRYVGQSEHQLREALTTAENISPCVLWIDEIEKGLSGSTSGNDGGVTTRMVGQFLFWLQECKKQVFVVATANDISLLPPELLRKGRFDEIFFIDLPDADERRDILKMYMARYLGLNFSGTFSDKIVYISDGFAGADLEAAVREIAYQKLSKDDFRLNEANILTVFENIIPLSKTNPEKIELIRKWGREHAISASTPKK